MSYDSDFIFPGSFGDEGAPMQMQTLRRCLSFTFLFVSFFKEVVFSDGKVLFFQSLDFGNSGRGEMRDGIVGGQVTGSQVVVLCYKLGEGSNWRVVVLRHKLLPPPESAQTTLEAAVRIRQPSHCFFWSIPLEKKDH